MYRYTINSTNAPPPLRPVAEFLPMVKPYLPELQYLTRGSRGASASSASLLPAAAPDNVSATARKAATAALDNGQVVQEGLKQLDRLMHGPTGVDGVNALSARALDRMRNGNVEIEAARLADSLGVPSQSCASATGPRAPQDSMTLSTRVLGTLDTLATSSAALSASLADSGLAHDPSLSLWKAPLVGIRDRADSAARSQDALVTAAFAAQQTANIVMRGCSHWDSPVVDIAPNATRIVTIQIEPLDAAQVKRMSPDAPDPISVTLLPPGGHVQASLAISALVAPGARFKTYDARPTGGGGSPIQVYEKSTQDNRFSYGASLGVTYAPWLDRLFGKPITAWFPEITVAEANPGHAFGFGGALSSGPVKLGIGGLLVRHTVLDGDTVKQTIPNAQFLSTRDTYGRPRFYVSVSIFNIAELLGLAESGGAPASSGGSGSSAPAASDAPAASRSRPTKP